MDEKMEVVRRRNKVEFIFDEEGSRAVYALLAGHPEWVSPEQYARAQYFYQAFFAQVQELGTNYPAAVGTKKGK